MVKGHRTRVLVVGGGPTGEVTAFGLARAGAEVTIVDKEAEVVAAPRACVYLASTLRVLLAGDAAHATNPIGGMGFTSGVQDALTLISSFSSLMKQEASEDVLDWYAYERRRIFLEVANPSAIEFKRRVQETDPARRLEDEADFFRLMEDRDMARAALMSIFALVSRAYRPDWRECYVQEDQARAGSRQRWCSAQMRLCG